MTEAESRIIELLESINQQLSIISEGVDYVVSLERVREEQRRAATDKLLEQSRIGVPPEKDDGGLSGLSDPFRTRRDRGPQQAGQLPLPP
jgi:hypothetical protein